MRRCLETKKLRVDNYGSPFEAESDDEDQAHDLANAIIEEMPDPPNKITKRVLPSILKLPGRFSSWMQIKRSDLSVDLTPAPSNRARRQVSMWVTLACPM